MPTRCDHENAPENYDSTPGLMVLMMVHGTGEKTDDLAMTHTNDTPMTLANSVGSLGTLPFVGPLDGPLTGT